MQNVENTSLQNNEFVKMQVYKMQLQQIAKWNGPSGPPYRPQAPRSFQYMQK